MFTPIFDALDDRLQGETTLAGKISQTVRRTLGGDAVRENYVILFPTAPLTLGDDRFLAPQSIDSTSDWEFDIRVVATTSGAVGELSGVVAARLIGHVLIVPGRTCTRIRLEPDETSDVEYDKTAQLYYQDLTFRFTSQRSA